MLQKKEGMKKFSLPSDKLLDIVDHHLKNFSEDHHGEDEIVSKCASEVRTVVSSKLKYLKFDHEMIESIILEQIKLVGSKKMYDKVSRFCFGESYFLKEQMKLYQWRENFFHQNFPYGSWYTDGGDDSHDFDTVPFQIVKPKSKVQV